MGSENKSSTIKALLEKAKNIQNQNLYKSINDMELNKYYEIKNAKYGKNRFNKNSVTITIEDDDELYDLILPTKYKFDDNECRDFKEFCEIGVIEIGKRRDIDFREISK